MTYEYRVIPAPARGEKAKGLKTPGDRFALGLTNLMNAMARDGWEYQRAETLPVEEVSGLLKNKVQTSFQSLLVFRRHVEEQVAAEEPIYAEPVAAAPRWEPEAPRLGPAVAHGEPEAAPRLGPAE